MPAVNAYIRITVAVFSCIRRMRKINLVSIGGLGNLKVIFILLIEVIAFFV